MPLEQDPLDTVPTTQKQPPTTRTRGKNKRKKTRQQIIDEVRGTYDFTPDPTRYHLINNAQDFLEVLEKIERTKPPVMGVDTETEGLRWEHRLIGVSFTFSDSDNYYIPFRHVTEEFQPNIDLFMDGLNYIFNLSDCKYVFHNYKFDRQKLEKEGIYLRGEVHDTMLMHYILNENDSHSLKELAVKHLDPNAKEYEKLIGDFRRKLGRKLKLKLREFGYEYIPIDIMVEYACRDTLYTFQLYSIFRKLLDEDPELWRVYERELDTLDALYIMERNGVTIDVEVLKDISYKLGKEIELLQKEVWELAGENFDLASPKQLRDVLTKKGIRTHRTTPAGEMSTDVVSLRIIASRFPFIQKILAFRAKSKLKGTYADPLPTYCDSEGRIHCNYKQAVAVTGRITCKDPSLQVIPRAVGDIDIRRAFVPPSSDYLMIFIDLSQIELRITAHFSKDPILLHAYATEEDIHSRTAAEIFGVDINNVTEAQRTIAKPINFGIIYGIGPNKLSETLEISFEEAKRYIATYLECYSGVATFINKYQRLAKKQGYIKNYFGRVRRLDNLLDPDLEDWKRERGYRQAVNCIIQGCQHPETPILTDQGYIPIKDIAGECIKTFTGYTNQYRIFECGKHSVYSVETSCGTTHNSADHKFFVYKDHDIGLRDCRDLKKGDEVLCGVLGSGGHKTNVGFSNADLELCGIFCQSGNYPVDDVERLSFMIPVNREGYLLWVTDYVAKRWPGKWSLKINGDYHTGPLHCISTDDADVKKIFDEWGLSAITSCTKELPPWTLRLSRDGKAAFVRGIFCGGAYFAEKQVYIKCPTYAYANSLQLLLTSLGIGATVHRRKGERQGRKFLVRILGSDLSLFKSVIGTRDAYTFALLDRVEVEENAALPNALVKDIGLFIRESPEYKTNRKHQQFTPTDQSFVSQMIKKGYGRKDKIRKILDKLPASKERYNFSDLLTSRWATVIEVKDLGYEIEMLDIELQGSDKAYLARGFYQHNSCADMFKIIITRVRDFLSDKKSEMIMNIHDEVVFYWHKDEIHHLGTVKRMFEDWDFRVPIIADIQYSEESWGSKVGL